MQKYTNQELTDLMEQWYHDAVMHGQSDEEAATLYDQLTAAEAAMTPTQRNEWAETQMSIHDASARLYRETQIEMGYDEVIGPDEAVDITERTDAAFAQHHDTWGPSRAHRDRMMEWLRRPLPEADPDQHPTEGEAPIKQLSVAERQEWKWAKDLAHAQNVTMDREAKMEDLQAAIQSGDRAAAARIQASIDRSDGVDRQRINELTTEYTILKVMDDDSTADRRYQIRQEMGYFYRVMGPAEQSAWYDLLGSPYETTADAEAAGKLEERWTQEAVDAASRGAQLTGEHMGWLPSDWKARAAAQATESATTTAAKRVQQPAAATERETDLAVAGPVTVDRRHDRGMSL